MKVKGQNYSFTTSLACFYLHYMIESHYIQLYISTFSQAALLVERVL